MHRLIAIAALIPVAVIAQSQSASPAVQAKPQTVIDTDHEFDDGSRIVVDTLSDVQRDNLTTLGQVWGFLKYHHPAVTSGSKHWDYELFRILPRVLAARDRTGGNAAVSTWVSTLGAISPCEPCVTVNAETVQFPPDMRWLLDEARLGPDLSRQLRSIHTNRSVSSKQFYVSIAPRIGFAVFTNEPDYPGKVPDAGYQLLSVFRFWNIIQYWFPYRDVIGEDWSAALREFIPRVATAKSVDDYQRELMGLIARVHDSHAQLSAPTRSRPPIGVCGLPARLRFVEGRPVVTESVGDFVTGDIVTAIDDVPVARLVQQWSPYYSASNETSRMRDIAMAMTRGTCGPAAIGITRGTSPTTVRTTRVTIPSPAGPPSHDLPGDTFRKLSDEVAYLKLSTIKGPEAAGFVNAAAGTKGMVIDIRGYPSDFVVFALGQLLVDVPTAFARFTQADPATPGAFHWGATETLKPAQPRYTGKVIIVVDEFSQSQSEYTAMAFRSSPNAKIVGSTTAGADGNVTPIPLPGGLRSAISGVGVFFPDKRPTQRIGIIPDVDVRPTIAGIRAGRDEVLEVAIREILGPSVSLQVIQRMISGSATTSASRRR